MKNFTRRSRSWIASEPSVDNRVIDPRTVPPPHGGIAPVTSCRTARSARASPRRHLSIRLPATAAHGYGCVGAQEMDGLWARAEVQQHKTLPTRRSLQSGDWKSELRLPVLPPPSVDGRQACTGDDGLVHAPLTAQEFRRMVGGPSAGG